MSGMRPGTVVRKERLPVAAGAKGKEPTEERYRQMCRPASFVLTKNNVYWSLTSDNHYSFQWRQ